MSLFRREPETLDGVTPKFSREEMRFGYRFEKVQIGGGFKDISFDRENIQYAERHSIIVAGEKLTTEKFFSSSMTTRDIIATMCNDCLAKKTEGSRAWEFLNENAHELNLSNKYWHAVEHLERVEKLRAEIKQKQDELERAEYISSVLAVEAREGKTLTKEEREILFAEFSGGKYLGESND